MQPHPAAFHLAVPDRDATAGARMLLLDDTYVSGARSQSAAAALRRAGAAATVIAPLGRVLRPDTVPRHAEFLSRHAAE
jgi:predicted amidophosphoribosyltransferase